MIVCTYTRDSAGRPSIVLIQHGGAPPSLAVDYDGEIGIYRPTEDGEDPDLAYLDTYWTRWDLGAGPLAKLRQGLALYCLTCSGFDSEQIGRWGARLGTAPDKVI